ncbi:ABC transporter ATP-binding protein [Ignatzschineria rhizosphaerae]|uniref:ABC transporter ATP-binding protein n=1 Tax=Ignatzschineria rhizosphaerae TaxID=2923279 RepID=A0ABY3X2K2_9GAMM|nr:ABC transporter ATP-binding protein [Ignatzschineria rhizosphaerae]UNM95242.1 ABC transporter ATP-binding protein [Ignatzschineria rhizosphaerae]
MLSYTKEVWKPILTLSKMSAMLSNGEKLLQEISFTLPKGAKLAVIGANGSGKSTLMQGLLGMIPTMFEKYLIAERPFLNIALKERARLLSYIGQQQMPEAETTVWEWCELSRFPHTTSKAENESIIIEALTRCNALSFAGRRLMSLSGGERQRVYLAGILAQETPIIILDEVNAAMDPKYKEEMEVLLHSLTDKTIISVTHDMNSLHHYSHLLALKSGRSIAFGETHAILTKDLLSELFDYPFTEVWHDDRVRYF